MDSLVRRLADLDASASDPSPGDRDLLELKAQLESLVPHVAAPVPLDHAEDPACRQAVEAARALGRTGTTAGGGDLQTEDSQTEDSRSKDSSAAQHEEILGEIRDYKLLAKLGEGGMGAVYKALHSRLNKVVALKVLPADKTRDAAALARFEREMQAVGRLQHPNIVAAHDAGEADGRHFLVMELVDGADLSQIVKQCGSLDVADACEVIRQAAVGLQEAHEHGMVHRDIKPSNLMLAVRRRKKKTTATVKILDLGLALLDERHAGGDELTSTGQLMGTIDYMAPEQATDTHNVDIRADIYALGATLYKLLTGVAPLADKKYDSAVKKIIALVNEQPPSIAEKRPDLPAELIALVDSMIAKQPGDRPATPEDVADALAPFCAGHNLAALVGDAAGDGAGDDRGGTVSLSAASVETSPTFLDSQAPTPPERTIDAPLGKPAEQPSSGRRRPPRKRLLIAAAAGAFFLLAAACGVLVLLVQTPDGGTVRIEILDPDIEVSIKGGEVLLAGVGKKDISFKPGEHVLHVKRGDFEFDTTSLQLNKNETIVVKVEWFDEGKLQATRDGNVIGSDAESIADSSTSPIAPPAAISPFNSEEAKAHQQAWAKHLGLPVEYTNSIGMKFRLIPPGEFMRGLTPEETKQFLDNLEPQKPFYEPYSAFAKSSGPRHKVVLTQPFYVGVWEVTQKEYETVMGDNPSYNASTGSDEEYVARVAGLDTSSHPVEGVTWYDAAEFCAKLSQREKLAPKYFRSDNTVTFLDGAGYRLPTEAEWEFACRAGTTSSYWSGDTREDLLAVDWMTTNAGRRSHAVALLKANPFGLHDMHGNLQEWCQDWLDEAFYQAYSDQPAIDPLGPKTGELRVLRGGGFVGRTDWAHSSHRFGHYPTIRLATYGFRVVLPAAAVRTLIAADPGGDIPTADAPLTAVARFDAENTDETPATWQPTPEQQAFLDAVDRLPPEEQVEAVRKKLQEVNPGFDGKVEHKIVRGRVFLFWFLTDEVSDIWPVGALRDLKQLRCEGSDAGKGRLADLGPLSGISLEVLYFQHNQVSDLGPLKGMPLSSLVCGDTRVSDLSPIEGAPLVKLEMSDTRVSDLSPLASSRLTYLNCGRTPVRDLSPLANLQLRELHCGDQVSDLSPLKGMPLVGLSCGGLVTDLSPLAESPLTHLVCTTARVRNLSPIAQLPLTHFNCSRTMVPDLSPLKGMKLETLHVQLSLYNSADEVVVRSLPLNWIGPSHGTKQPPEQFWKEIEARRERAEQFADETAKLPVREQIDAVNARIQQLSQGQAGRLACVVNDGDAVAATLDMADYKGWDDMPDVTPLMALKKLKKLTLIGGPFWLDISCVSRLPLEELTVSDDIALKNSVTLRAMESLKTINGRPAAEFLNNLAP